MAHKNITLKLVTDPVLVPDPPEPEPINKQELNVEEKLALLAPFMVGNQMAHNEIVDDKSKTDKPHPADINEANLVSSICYIDEEITYHQPVLDIDMGCWLQPSSTSGHFHLAIDKPLTTDQYDKLLKVLVEVGIVQKGIYELQWKDQGATFIRPPWHKKTSESGGSQTTMAFVQYKLDNGETVAFDPTVYSVNAMKKAVELMNKGAPPEHFPPDSKGEGWEDIGYTKEDFVSAEEMEVAMNMPLDTAIFQGNMTPKEMDTVLPVIESMIKNMDSVANILEKLATEQANTAHAVEQIKAKLELDKLEGEKFDEPF